MFIAADYSQIELRLMAHFSGDPSMTSLLSNPSGDFFRQLAAQWTGLTESNVTDKRREQTKRLVYGILYGMGVNALAEQMDCSAAEAADNTEKFKSAFPGITAWLQQTVESCRKLGYAATWKLSIPLPTCSQHFFMLTPELRDLVSLKSLPELGDLVSLKSTVVCRNVQVHNDFRWP